MPPFLPRKRSTPPASPRPTPVKKARLADALDAEATNVASSLKRMRTFSLGSDDTSHSSLSDVDSDQFEDVAVQVKQTNATHTVAEEDENEDEDEDDEDTIWEDAAMASPAEKPVPHIPMTNGPIQITLRKDDEDIIDYGTTSKAGSGKKGPSKREKQVRIMTHQLHVQYLLWHNAVRNSWTGDKKVQDILVKQLPPQIVREVEKWKRASGLVATESTKAGAAKGKKRKQTKDGDRAQRDWGQPSSRLETGKPDMSRGDPLIMLLRVLSAYWKKRFAITAPGLRKRGYGTKHGLKQDIVSLRNDEHDPQRHGEKISNLAELREIAEKGQGSRDVGAQLFTALLRGLGIQSRLVASLQPSGYGWTKFEQMVPRKIDPAHLEADSSGSDDTIPMTKAKPTPTAKGRRSTTNAGRRKSKVIKLDSDGEEEVDDDEGETDIKDDDSIIDVTPSMPKQRKPKYDRDLVFPIYWTEAVSPITNKVIPVSPLVLETPVATTPETLSLFEPRGAKAEKGRQVMAYVIAYSEDGTAKDVTVRYLRKHIWPGKTKGVRIPVEKVSIYDRKGRVKRYEDYDWFKHILSLYTRSHSNRTAVDDIEDSADLVPQQPEKKNEDDGVDTLQSLKSSADFVLERFLRREEALRPDAIPVRMFVSGKGDKYKEEPVYRRADVERCLTAESWHKEGRRPKLGEAPMKMVPVRAVTLTRKREAEEHERRYGEKQMQGLYSWDQSEWIIPPPIEDGVIPKNAYGNMDCFVPSMVPKGAVHIPLKGTVRICKKLDIDFAEAVTGFEFGNKRAVPVCTGVVVAKENEILVKDAWKEWNEEQRRKEDTKMEKLVLDLWRKFVLGLRIRERVQDMYGEEIGIVHDVPTGFTKEDAIAIDDEDVPQGGGFVNPDEDEEEMGGGFLLPHEEQTAPMEDLIMDEQPRQAPPLLEHSDARCPTPSSVSTSHGKNPSAGGVAAATSDAESDLHEQGTETEQTTLSSDNDIKISVDTQRKPTKSGLRRGGYAAKSNNKKLKQESPAEEADSQSDSSQPTDTEPEGSEREESYTPQPTRTRSAKAKLSTKSDTASRKPKAATSKKTRKPIKKSTSDSNENVKVSGGDTPELSPSANKVRRGRVRSRKSDVNSDTKNHTPKRSARLLRKESTVVTSPYFEG